MVRIIDHPAVILLSSFIALCVCTSIGAAIRRLRGSLSNELREDFGVVVAASLTLLGLIIGFTFSMAISRYDQRKNYEEAEANAIGTEYLRVDFLPAAEAAPARSLLKEYASQRVRFYEAKGEDEHRASAAETTRLQGKLWAAVKAEGPVNLPPGILALIVSGMNDVINSQGYTQAAWLNRIPPAAWLLMLLIAMLCNFMVGYGSRNANAGQLLLVILPFAVAISFFLIADIDSPRGGIIHITAQNLRELVASL
jgi:hypothetical protein